MTAPGPLSEKYTLGHLRRAREAGVKVAMLTCYDYTNARLMQEAGVPALLVGDSAANVVLGHPTTLPVSLEFMMEITAAVRRGGAAGVPRVGYAVWFISGVRGGGSPQCLQDGEGDQL